MSLAAAIRDRDVAELPSRRDEDWRWTDLRGLLRALPEPSAPFEGDPGEGPFDALTVDRRRLANGGDIRIEVPAGQSATIALRVLARGAGAHAGTATISVGAGGYLWLLESYESDGPSVAQTTLTIEAAEGAGVERIVLARDHREAVSVSLANVVLSPRAEFAQTILTSGARRQRIETRFAHPGGHAKIQADAVYILSGKSHADLTSVVTHDGTDGITGQLAKGVVRDQARGVFQGRIVVAEGADRTDAKMGHHALILSDRAEVDAKPELEIYADDVACAHGNTIGALDEDALFYARQRGIPEVEAKALLIEAFVGEVVDRIGHEGAREIARAWVADRLRA